MVHGNLWRIQPAPAKAAEKAEIHSKEGPINPKGSGGGQNDPPVRRLLAITGRSHLEI